MVKYEPKQASILSEKQLITFSNEHQFREPPQPKLGMIKGRSTSKYKNSTQYKITEEFCAHFRMRTGAVRSYSYLDVVFKNKLDYNAQFYGIIKMLEWVLRFLTFR